MAAMTSLGVCISNAVEPGTVIKERAPHKWLGLQLRGLSLGAGAGDTPRLTEDPRPHSLCLFEPQVWAALLCGIIHYGFS